MPRLPLLSLSDLADGAAELRLTSTGAAQQPLIAIDLDQVGDWKAPVVDAAVLAATASDAVLIGVAHRPPPPAAERLLTALTCTLTPPSQTGPTPAARTCVEVPDPGETVAALAQSTAASPGAAVTLAGLLEVTAQVPVRAGLIAESLAYSMLLAGPEFQAWRARTPRRPLSQDPDPVLLSRDGGTLNVLLNRPRRHNAFGQGVRDGIIEAMDLASLDPSITTIELAGNGPSFCSGGDLDEFGTTPDVTTAHLIRLRQSAGAAVHRCADRVRVTVHGACIGAGIEIPAFANRIEARPDAYFQLPELRMGLVPGAGGTVSIPRRIGRWRTAYLALSGQPVDVATALRWGLVDARA